MKKQEILSALYMGSCAFSYTKQDGDLRIATGTLNMNLIPAEKKPKTDTKTETVNKDKKSDVVRYFDFGSNGWRSFLAENLISLSVMTE
jgi:hypothetical protein